MKKCPYCAEEIKDEAIKCRYCGELLNKKTKVDKKEVSNTGDFGKIVGITIVLIIVAYLLSTFSEGCNRDSNKRRSSTMSERDRKVYEGLYEAGYKGGASKYAW